MTMNIAPSTGTTQPSIGAGIAIAGIWLASAAVTIIFMLIVFVWGNSDTTSSESSASIWIVLGLLALPTVVAYSITNKILGKDY